MLLDMDDKKDVDNLITMEAMPCQDWLKYSTKQMKSTSNK